MTLAIEKINKSVARIDEVAQEVSSIFGNSDGEMAKEISVAIAMREMRQLLTPEVMAPIMELMNTDLGFRTDKDPKTQPDKNIQPYGMEVVRDVVIEAKMRGFHLVGNEFNIIAGRFYGAQNGFRRNVKQFKGLTKLKTNFDVPRLVGDKGAIIKCSASWELNGQPDDMNCEIAIRVNSFMGTDAIVGKAERKLYKRIYERVSGVNVPDAEPDDLDGAKNVTPEQTTKPTFARATPQPDEQTKAPEPPKAKPAAQTPKAKEPAPPAPQRVDPLPPAPAPEPAPESETQAPTNPTPQQQLYNFCHVRGFTFDHVKELLAKHKLHPDPESLPDFVSIPEEVCMDCLVEPENLSNELLYIKASKKPRFAKPQL
jgi:hypothetical protein